MKTTKSILLAILALGAVLPSTQVTANAAETPAAVAVDSAAALAAYPLATCVISGDKLEAGDMGAIIEYVHKEAGKPDRLVRLCCKGCVKEFKKDPAKYLKIIDDAAAAKAKGAASDGHAGHVS
jgi:hypothetical protein